MTGSASHRVLLVCAFLLGGLVALAAGRLLLSDDGSDKWPLHTDGGGFALTARSAEEFVRQSDLIVVGTWEALEGAGDELPYDAEEARARSGDPNLVLPTISVTYVAVRVEQVLRNTTDVDLREGSLVRLRLPWIGLPWDEAAVIAT